MENQPDGKGFALTTTANSNPNRCWLKHAIEICHDAYAFTFGTIFHYDCKDNHDCGGSYVQIRDANSGSFNIIIGILLPIFPYYKQKQTLRNAFSYIIIYNVIPY